MYPLACCISSVSASVTQSCKEQSAYFIEWAQSQEKYESFWIVGDISRLHMVDTKFLQVCKHEVGLKSEIIILGKILNSNTTLKFDQIKDIIIFVFCRKTTELSVFLNVYGRNVIALTL
jgi:hypothetical protein